MTLQYLPGLPGTLKEAFYEHDVWARVQQNFRLQFKVLKNSPLDDHQASIELIKAIQEFDLTKAKAIIQANKADLDKVPYELVLKLKDHNFIDFYRKMAFENQARKKSSRKREQETVLEASGDNQIGAQKIHKGI
jgi:hypothetical protein